MLLSFIFERFNSDITLNRNVVVFLKSLLDLFMFFSSGVLHIYNGCYRSQVRSTGCYWLCECVTVAMNGCWLMWLGDCCIRLCWWGLWSCWEKGTGCSAARLPATLLITGTVWDCDVFKPRKTKKTSVRWSHSDLDVGNVEGWWTHSVLWPWLQTEAWWGSASAGGCDGNCGCWSACWPEEGLHPNQRSGERQIRSFELFLSDRDSYIWEHEYVFCTFKCEFQSENDVGC